MNLSPHSTLLEPPWARSGLSVSPRHGLFPKQSSFTILMSPTCPTVCLSKSVSARSLPGDCRASLEELDGLTTPCEGIRLRCLALSTITQRVPLTTLWLTGEKLGSLSLTLSLTWQDESNQPKSLDG